MSSDLLLKARRYEAESMKSILPKERPAYHISANTGWLNDPNGFSYYKGQYHVFHQYHPYSNEWGPMHWGHLISKDMIKWERLPAAFAPDKSWDMAGVFSGSAIVDPEGRHFIIYTGVSFSEDSSPEKRKMIQSQCIAYGDGLEYEKYEGNPVISAEDLPQGASSSDFRDPKIWKDGEYYYCVTVTAMPDGGAVLLHRSPDGIHWEYVTILDRSNNQLGSMWECPDFFELDGKAVLLVSPMDIHPSSADFHPGHCTLTLIGDYDREKHSFKRETCFPLDQGLDFYAPQSIVTPDGRRVMIGWMQGWANTKFVPPGFGYFGQLTLPREFSVTDGKLIQKPIREIEAYRCNPVEVKNKLMQGHEEIEGISGRVCELILTISDFKDLKSFTIRLASDDTYGSDITYDPEDQLLTLDRSRSGYLYDILHTRRIPLPPVNDSLTLHILMDRYSVEIFINDGSQVASFTLYTPLKADEIHFITKGKTRMNLTKYDLKV